MVFMNARKRNKTIIAFLVGALSLGLLLSVSMYWQGGSTTSTGGTTVSGPLGQALQDFNQGGSLMQQGKAAEAQKKLNAAKNGFEQVLKTEPKNYQVLGDLATTYFYLNNADKAIETVKKALEISPSFAPARLNLGIYLAYGKNNPTDAITELKKVQKGDASYGRAQQLISEIGQLQKTLPPSSGSTLPPNSGSTLPPQNGGAPAQNGAPAQGETKSDPTTGKTDIKEGDTLPPNHPKID